MNTRTRANRRERKGQNRTRSTRGLQLERLETRQLMAADLPGVVRGGHDWYLDTNGDPSHEIDLDYGKSGDILYAAGDWAGTGRETPGIARKNANGGLEWALDLNGDPQPERRFFFGLQGDQAAVGDFNGDGITDVAAIRPSAVPDPVVGLPTLTWYIAYGPFPQFTDQFLPVSTQLIWGFRGDRPVVGDWDGDGTDNPGIVSQRPEGGLQRWYLATNQGLQTADFGFFGDPPVVGDWDGNGRDDLGVAVPDANRDGLPDALLTWYLDTDRDPSPEITHSFGFPTDIPVAGPWRFPEAVVSASGQEIYTNHRIDLGDVTLGQSVSRTFTLRNTGTLALDSTLQMTGSGFGVSNQVTARLGSQQADDFGFTFTAGSAGKKSGRLVLNTNDADEPVFVIELTANVPPDETIPTASLQAANVTQLAATAYTFQVTYSDNIAVKFSTLDNADIKVSGPGGFSQGARFVSVDQLSNGTPRRATYSITPPGGGWDCADNGTYAVTLVGNQVTDTSGLAAKAGELGRFQVAVPDIEVPTASLQTTNVTQPAGTTYTFQVTYSDNVAVKFSTLDNADIKVSGPRGFSQDARFVSVDQRSNGTPRRATYSITPPGGGWDWADNGTYVVTMVGNQVTDTSGLAAKAGELGRFQVAVPDETVPTASLQAANVTQPAGTTYMFQVTYSDNAAVKFSTLDNADIQVSGPGGFSQGARFVSVDQRSDGTPRRATYSITPPGGGWDWADNGTYVVTMVGNQVTDTSGLPVAAGELGQFQVDVPDIEIPTASLQAANVTQSAGTAYTFQVTYSDNAAVKFSTLDNADIQLSGPGGFSQDARFVSVDQRSDGTPRQATYTITPPGGRWDWADNGTYVVTMADDQVTDTSGLAVAAGELGRFQVYVPGPEDQPQGDIWGVVWQDRNTNRIQDNGEPGLADWQVYLDENQNGRYDAGESTQTTDASGRYVFRGLNPGTYTVAQQLSAGWWQTFPSGTGAAAFELPTITVSTTGSTQEGSLMAGEVASQDGGLGFDGATAATAALDLIGLTAFRSDSRLSGVDGRGFAAVIIDTGIDRDHAFFGPDRDHNGIADRLVYQYDFADQDADAGDWYGHGTHVSSIVGSQDSQYPGIAPGADLIHLKIFRDGSDRFQFSYMEQALQWVVENAERYNIASVNMSLVDGQNYGQAVTAYGVGDELAALAAKNVIVVSCAGNDYYRFGGAQGVTYPAADPNSLAVGAVWDTGRGAKSWLSGAKDLSTGPDRIASFSQRDRNLTDVFAPGAIITAARNGGGTIDMAGTSMAAPHVAGAAVLAQQLALQHLGRRLTPAEFQMLLQKTGKTIHDGDDEQTNVTSTGLDFSRLDLLALGEAILGMKAEGQTVTVRAGQTTEANFGNAKFAVSNTPLATQGGGATAGASLMPEFLTNIVDAAVARWQQAGIAPEDAAMLQTLQYQVADLPGNTVSQTEGTLVTLDRDAGGPGWFIDATPGQDDEFSGGASDHLTAQTEEAARGLDLLTAVIHEMGNVLAAGQPAAASGVDFTATYTLAPGVRSVPEPAAATFQPHDVNRDGRVTPLDVLVLIQAINLGGVARMSLPRMDVSSDGVLSALDVLTVINLLNGQQTDRNTVGEAEGGLAAAANVFDGIRPGTPASAPAASLPGLSERVASAPWPDTAAVRSAVNGGVPAAAARSCLPLALFSSDEFEETLDGLAADVERLWYA